MPLRQYDIAVGQDIVGVSETGTVTAVTGGAANLGGTTGIRLIVDDAVVTSKQEAYRMLEVLAKRLFGETWPPS